jgi:hypothetical protein
MALGVEVRTRTARVARGIPVDTDTLYVTGDAASGSTTAAVPVQSIADFSTEYGSRSGSNDVLYDYIDNFFQEGGKKAYVARETAGALDSALALFDPALGPGQVAATGQAPGADTFTALTDHAHVNNRVALLDVANGDDVAAMSGLGDTLAGLSDVEYGALFGPWTDVPAPAGVVGGGARQVPASSTIAALCARADALGNPNRAAAGRDFPLQYAVGFVESLTTADREALLDSGVNTFASIYGVLENYGFQTAVPQTTETPYWQFNCARARMWLKAKAAAAMEPYVFRTIDGQGRLLSAVKGDLDAVALSLYQVGGLFGETPQEAFATTVSAAVNTVDSIAQGEIHAVQEVRLSLHAKAVIVDLVTVPVTGNVSA